MEPVKLFQYNTLGALMAAKVPYAAVVPHQAEVIFRQRFEMTDEELEARIESYYDGENLFRSIKIHGDFAKMHVRMIPKSTPEMKFAEVATHQPEYTRENVWQDTICTLFRMTIPLVVM